MLTLPRIGLVLFHVSNMEKAIDFYCNKLGLQLAREISEPRLACLVQEKIPLILVEVNQSFKVKYPQNSQSLACFGVNDLEAAVHSLRKKGVAFLYDKVIVSEYGKLNAFYDPDGNVHELIEWKKEKLLTKPEIIEVQINVHNLAIAEEFYCNALGFSVEEKQEDFFTLSHESFPLIIGKSDYKTNLNYPDCAQTVFNVQVNNLEALLTKLKQNSNELIHDIPQKCPLGSYAAIKDPSGNVLELLQMEAIPSGKTLL